MLRARPKVPPTFARTSSRLVTHEPCGGTMVTWRGGLVCPNCFKVDDWTSVRHASVDALELTKVPFKVMLPNRAARRADDKAARRRG